MGVHFDKRLNSPPLEYFMLDIKRMTTEPDPRIPSPFLDPAALSTHLTLAFKLDLTDSM